MSIANNVFTTDAINAAADTILSPLVTAAAAAGAKKEASSGFNDTINAGVLGGYAETVVFISRAFAAGAWTTGKQKGGKASASALLKGALEAGAKERNVNSARAKRLVEVSAAILLNKKTAIAGVVEAAQGGDGDANDVVEALFAADIKREADLLRHVGATPEADPVAKLAKAWRKLTPAQQAEFALEIAKPE